jgi:Ca-activated chloride channel family protein
MTVAALWPLWLLALLPLAWLLALGRGERLGRVRLGAALVLRSVAVVLAVVALMQPTMRQASDAVAVVYALDVSRSVSLPFAGQALRWMGETNAAQRPASSRVILFADRPRVIESPDDARAVALSDDAAAERAGGIARDATNLEEALVASLFAFPPGHAKRLVLISDANQTEGDVWRIVPRLKQAGVRMFTLAAPVAVRGDAWVERVLVPEGVRQQQPVEVSVEVFARTAGDALVELRHGPAAAQSRRLSLSAGSNAVAFRTRFARRGMNELTLRVRAEGDEVPENDLWSGAVWVGPRPSVLYVEDARDSANFLAQALGRQAIDVTMADASRISADPASLATYDAVILSDVPAAALSATSQARLERYVRDEGGGLVFVAGENTYGRDGFSNSVLERMLPVRFEARRKRRDLDLVLLIDRSYSMRGRRLELAKLAALATLDLLEEQHRLAVVGFDARPHDVVPLAPVGTKRRAEALIPAMTASGQTNIYAALLHAQRLLAGSQAQTKHIVLLSDGKTASPASSGAQFSSSEQAQELIRRVRADTMRSIGATVPEPEPLPSLQEGFPALVAQLVADKVTLSTVAIGERINLELMAGLAKWGGGKHYVAQDETQLPSLFVAEARRLLGESIIEEPFRPVLKSSTPAVRGIDFGAAPELKGLVVTRPKRFSEVALEAPEEMPLLSQTTYGLGRTTAFLSDAKNRWGADWLAWPGYAQLWAQVVRDTMRQRGEPLTLSAVRENSEAVVQLTAQAPDGRYRSDLSPRVRITRPDGASRSTPLRQVAQGTYVARIPLAVARSGGYRFELLAGGKVTQQDAAQAGARTLFYPYSDEYRALPPDVALLKALAAQTGGSFGARPEEIFDLRGDASMVEKPLWQYFAWSALLAFLLDTLVRRAPVMPSLRRRQPR